MAQQPNAPQGPKLRYVDRQDVSETFVDSLEKFVFDGTTLRLEFVINRFDEPKPPHPPTGNKITAARIVITPQGFGDMLDKMQALMAQLVARGIVKHVAAPPPGTGTGKPN